MKKPEISKEEVYLALKGVFAGNDAKIRHQSVINKRIEANIHRAEIKVLTQEHGINVICQTAGVLLKDEIFESPSKAKLCLPNAFESAATRNALSAVLQANTQQPENVSIQATSERRQEEVHEVDEVAIRSMSTAIAAQAVIETSHVETPPTESVLDATFFPYRTQHHILTKVQHILEDACYAFAETKVPDILRQEAWDCPEAGELSRWAAILTNHDAQFAPGMVDSLGKPSLELMKSIRQLRHTAVHRLRITAKDVLAFVSDAELFVKLLDDTRLETISGIRQRVEEAMFEMMCNKDMLEAYMAHTKAHFAAARGKLDREQDEKLAVAMEEDKQYDVWIGRNLVQAVAELA